MRYFKSETVLDRIHEQGLAGFAYATPQGFTDWKKISDQKCEAICKVVDCRCTDTVKAQHALGILKQIELAYSGKYKGTKTFWQFLTRVLGLKNKDGATPKQPKEQGPDPTYIKWEVGEIQRRAGAKLCHTTSRGFSCYCDEPTHTCPKENASRLVERER